MCRSHIPDVLRTGHFHSSDLLKQIDGESATKSVYQIRYQCLSLESLQQYRTDFAPRLQAEHTTRYQGRFTASRAVFETLD
jgi:hypothetical protein